MPLSIKKYFLSEFIIVFSSRTALTADFTQLMVGSSLFMLTNPFDNVEINDGSLLTSSSNASRHTITITGLDMTQPSSKINFHSILILHIKSSNYNWKILKILKNVLSRTLIPFDIFNPAQLSFDTINNRENRASRFQFFIFQILCL